MLIKTSSPALREVSKYGVFSGLYFPAFGLNREIYGVNFQAVDVTVAQIKNLLHMSCYALYLESHDLTMTF